MSGASAAVASTSKRGRKAGSKVPCAAWTDAEDAILHACVQSWDASKGVKKAMWAHAASKLSTGRTVASIEQHWYYLERKRTKANTPVTGGGAASKVSARVPVDAKGNGKAPGPSAKRSKTAFKNYDSAGSSISIVPKAPKSVAGLPVAESEGEDGHLGAARNTRFGKWGFYMGCPTCGTKEFVEDGTVDAARGSPAPKIGGAAYKFLPCHSTCKERQAGLTVLQCSACGPFVAVHCEQLYADEKGNVELVPCACAGCIGFEMDDDEADDGEFAGEGADEMRWLAKCDREGRCFACGEKHNGQSVEYWIPHPQDESDHLDGVDFCYLCYDDVRNDRRRDLGMSHYSDSEQEASDDDPHHSDPRYPHGIAYWD